MLLLHLGVPLAVLLLIIAVEAPRCGLTRDATEVTFSLFTPFLSLIMFQSAEVLLVLFFQS